MTTPVPTPTLAEQIAVITAVAAEDLAPVWNGLTANQATEALLDLLPAVVDTWGYAAAAFSADWYDNQREDNGIGGRFTAVIPDLGDTGATELALWGAEPINLDEPDWTLARSRVEGGLQRRITNFSRDTIMTSAIDDPQARGWQRVARAGGCAFCVMLAGRGLVYSKKSARFGAHDHCNCSAVPAWGGKAAPVKPYKPSSANVTDADRARVLEWLAANP